MLAAKLGLASADTERAATVQPTTRSAVLDVTCPFKGLASFDIADGGYFFGRERAVGELVARLASTTFLAVVGPSGSGKSSVVRAGLAPALQAGVLPGSTGWPLALLRPGDRPVATLQHAVAVAMQVTSTGDEGGGTDAWLDRLAAGGRLVLLVDQFEEIWTVCHDADERERFLNNLAILAHDPGRRALVIVAIRSEFYGRCAEHRELAELASTSTMLLGPMTAEELTRAIELPARAAGLRLDANLAPTLVTDVLQQPGALPLLSSTLLELWQRREGRSMRIEAYRALGAISGAVGRMAEDMFGRLAPADQAIARAILLRLAAVDDGGVATRRRVPIGEIDGGRSPDVQRVLAALVDGRLLTVDAGHVEPAHEALLREWPRMRAWLEDGADARRIREHVAVSARDWANAGREPSELYRGAWLQAAADWATDHPDELNPLEREFLDDSRATADAELVRQRRINVRLRGLLGIVGVLLALALGAGAVALRQADAARDASLVARVRELDGHPGSPISRTHRSRASSPSPPVTCCPLTSRPRRCCTRRGSTTASSGGCRCPLGDLPAWSPKSIRRAGGLPRSGATRVMLSPSSTSWTSRPEGPRGRIVPQRRASSSTTPSSAWTGRRSSRACSGRLLRARATLLPGLASSSSTPKRAASSGALTLDHAGPSSSAFGSGVPGQPCLS